MKKRTALDGWTFAKYLYIIIYTPGAEQNTLLLLPYTRLVARV